MIYTDCEWEHYLKTEQEDTTYNLNERIYSVQSEKQNDILVRFDGRQLTNEGFQFLTQLSEILKDSGEIGEMEFDIFKITINRLKTYEKDLIK